MAKLKSLGTFDYAWITLGATSIALLIATLVTQFLLFDPVKDTFVTMQANARIDQVASHLDQKQKQLQMQLNSIAGSPELVEVLLHAPNIPEGEEQRITQLIPNALRTKLIPAGKATVEPDAILPFSFSSLDMVNRSEQGLQVFAEAIQSSDSWVLMMVQSVKANEKIIGTLFVYLDINAMVADLPFEDIMGQISLKQQFGRSSASTLFQIGSSTSKRTPINRNLHSPVWEVEYVPSDQVTNFGLIQPIIFWLPLMVFFPLSLLGALMGFWQINARIKQESRTLADQIRDAFRGEHVISDGFRLGGLIDIDLMLAKLQPSLEATEKLVIRAASTPTKVTDTAGEDLADVGNLASEEIDVSEVATSATEIDPLELDAIFRAYDIRGIVNETLTPEVIYGIGQAIASAIISQGDDSAIVGTDGRISSPAVAESLIRGLLDSGVNVSDLGMVPTPVIYFATQTLGISSAVMVTGSHNPPEYNGFKIMIANETLTADEIQQIRQNYMESNFVEGTGQLIQADVIDEYLDAICDDIVVAQPLNLVIDCGNGIAGAIAPDLFSNLGCFVTPLYCDVDGNFPNHHPDPTMPSNLEDLMLAVTSSDADLGIAFDGDGDRVVAVTNTGNIIWPDRLLMLFAKDIVSRNPGADVIHDVKCSRNLNTVVSNLGGRPIICRTGHSYLKAKMKETGALLGGEMSGHICFKDRWNGFDDGLYAAARLLEIVGAQTKNLEELFNAFPKCASTAEIRIAISDLEKFSFMANLSQNASFGDGSLDTLDGIKVNYPDGWGLVRASNSTPNLTLRFEADQESGLRRIKGIFKEQMLKIEPGLEISF